MLAVNEPNACGNHMDASSLQMDAPSVQAGARTTANKEQIVRMHRNQSKPPDSPAEAAMQRSNEPDGCRDCAETSSACTHVQSIGNDARMAENEAESIRTCRIGSKTQDSPTMHETATPKPTYQWKWVSSRGINIYIPWNTTVEALSTANGKIAFGQVESAGEAVVARVVDEMAGNGVGNRNRGNSDVDGTTSGGNVDLI